MFKLEFSTSNAAFDGCERCSEIARILRNIAAQIEHDGDCADGLELIIRDSNGNKIGRLHLSEREES